MKTLVRSLLCLTVFAVLAAPSLAATLTYTQETGRAVIDPTDGGTNPTGKVLGYGLQSAGKFFVDPARVSVYPAPAPTFFTSNADLISDNDLTFAGVSTPINLGQLFVNKANSLAELQGNFTGQFAITALGGGEPPMSLVFIPIPEPATAGLAGLSLLGLAAFRRRTA